MRECNRHAHQNDLAPMLLGQSFVLGSHIKLDFFLLRSLIEEIPINLYILFCIDGIFSVNIITADIFLPKIHCKKFNLT